VSSNISEFHGGATYEATKKKFGKKKADAQAVAVAMSKKREPSGHPVKQTPTGNLQKKRF